MGIAQTMASPFTPSEQELVSHDFVITVPARAW